MSLTQMIDNYSERLRLSRSLIESAKTIERNIYSAWPAMANFAPRHIEELRKAAGLLIVAHIEHRAWCEGRDAAAKETSLWWSNGVPCPAEAIRALRSPYEPQP